MSATSSSARCCRLSRPSPPWSSWSSCSGCSIRCWRAIAAGVAIPVALLLGRATPALAERSRRTHNLDGELTASAEQGLSALPLVQAFVREDEEHQPLRRSHRRHRIDAGLRATAREQRLYVGTSTLTALATAVVIGVGGLRVVDGGLTLGGLLVFLAYLAALYAPVQTLARLAVDYANAVAERDRRVPRCWTRRWRSRIRPGPAGSPRRPSAATSASTTSPSATNPTAPSSPTSTSTPPPATTIALVGRTGAGKSTLVSLIPRFFDPGHGRVTLDGIDLRDLSPHRPPPPRRPRPPRTRPPADLHRRQHRLRPPRRHPPRDRRRRRRQRPRVHRPTPRRLRHHPRRTRRHPVRRPTPTHRHRPRPAQRRTRPHPRRTHLRPRRRNRTPPPRRPRPPHRQPHHLRHRPPPLHHPQRRPHRRPRPRPHHRQTGTHDQLLATNPLYTHLHQLQSVG